MSKIKKLYWEQGPDDEDSETMGATHVLGTWSPTTTWPGAKKGSARLLFPDCRHWRQRFELQGGLHVFASAWLDKPREPGGRPRPGFKGQPDIGFYLDSRWASESLLVSLIGSGHSYKPEECLASGLSLLEPANCRPN